MLTRVKPKHLRKCWAYKHLRSIWDEEWATNQTLKRQRGRSEAGAGKM